jgi:hypothetical protein
LAHTKPSIEALSEEVLAKVYEKDIATLEQLELTKEEFKRFIWPHVPWSNPETNMPFEYYWRDIHQKSTWALRRVLVQNGGKKYDLIRVYFAKGVRDYNHARLYRDTRLVVKDEAGEEKELNIFGSVLELNGAYKILSYIHE